VITASLLVHLAVPLTGLARVDLWDGGHRMLGRPATAVEGLQAVVVALAVLYGVTFLTNTLFGRFFCGWGCPVGYVSRLGEDADRRRPDRLRWALSHLSGAGFVATFVGSAMCWWVDPRVMLEGSVTARVVTAGVFLVLWAGGFAHAFLWRFGFCLHVCPIGLYYRYVTSRPPVGIVFAEDPDPCIQCGACTKVCPADLEPRRLGDVAPTPAGEGPGAGVRYGDAECLRCGDCVEACRMVFLPRAGKTPPLRFGVHREDGEPVPPEPGQASGAPSASPKLDLGEAARLDPPSLGDVASVRTESVRGVPGPVRGPVER
jgi:ferredoxin